MSIVTFEEINERATFRATVDDRIYHRVFLIESDDWGDGPVVAGLELIRRGYGIGAQHPKDTFSRVVDISTPPKENSRTVFEGHVKYAIKTATPEQEIANPLMRRAVLSGGFITAQEEYAIDADGTRVVNSAGAPFDPAPMRDNSICTITVTWNVKPSGFSLASWNDYKDAVNEDTFSIRGYEFTPGIAKLAGMGYSFNVESGIEFVRLSVTVNYQRLNEDWPDGPFSATDQFVPNFSYYEAPDVSGDLPKQIMIPVFDEDGKKVREVQPQHPLPLELDGTIAADGIASVQHLRPYRRLPFRALGLPP